MFKTCFLTLAILLLVSTLHAASWDKVIIDARSGQTLTNDQFSDRLAASNLVVIGEKHYTQEVQAAEGRIISLLPWGDLFLGWEFLNFSAQNQTDILWQNVMSGTLSVADFLMQTQGTAKASVYAPVLEALKLRGSRIYGLNLSRAEKEPVTQGGLRNANPNIIPPGFNLGGQAYHERFKEAMGDHVPAEKLQNYFEAQCLTDDVMAFNFLNINGGHNGVLIAGSFHTDFFDGTVMRLRARAPTASLLTIKIVDASDYSESELLDTLIDPKYGVVADLVYIVNEPN